MRIRHAVALTGLGLLAYAFFLLLTVPAAVAWSLVEEDVPVRVYGPGGTLWSGTAEAVVDGPRRLDAVRWNLQPASLLTLSPSAKLSGQLPGGSGEGEIEIGPGGTITLRDVRASTAMDTVLAWIQRGALQPLAAGRVELLMPHGVVRNGLLQQADGLLTWTDAAVGPNARFPLGNLALRLQPAQPNGTSGTLTARDGPLTVNGTLDLRPNGDFQLQARVRPTDPGDPAARRRASLFGLANPSGTTLLTATGNVDGTDLRLVHRGE